MATYEDVVNLALRRSLFFPANEIYANAPAGFYDFGPYGATIRRKIVGLWRKHLVQKEEFFELDGAITMPEDVFKASGHLTNFNDPITQCKKCNTIHRADKLIESHLKAPYERKLIELIKKRDALAKKTPVNQTEMDAIFAETNAVMDAMDKIQPFREAMPVEELTKGIRQPSPGSKPITCPKCKGELMDVKRFNMMVKADVGVSTKAACYLRPETCQTIFVDWSRMVRSMRVKLPKGVAQAGKSFRNEISPRQTLLRQVEFSQMEAEVFFDPTQINEIERWDEVKAYALRVMKAGSDKIEYIPAEKLVKDKTVSGKLIVYYLARTQQLFEKYGIPVEKMRFRQLDDKERAFYAKEGWDFEVETSLGWVELIANNYRTDYDLKGHMEGSKTDLQFVTPEGRKFIPHIWEISIGLDRTFYAVLEMAYRQKDERVWLSLPPALAPLHVGIFPLMANEKAKDLVKKAKEIQEELRECYEVQYDDAGSIGKRYARMDEIGVPWCITIDFDSVTNNDVTIRARDTAAQKRVKISELRDTLYQLITGKMHI